MRYLDVGEYYQVHRKLLIRFFEICLDKVEPDKWTLIEYLNKPN